MFRVNGTSYTRYLLRESRREGKKTTILNITPWGEQTCEAMIKSAQQQELTEEGFRFITALTKPQIY